MVNMNENAARESPQPQTQSEKQVNISQHSESEFQNIVERGLIEGGIHLNAGKGHGKTRLLFNMAQSLRDLDTVRVMIFDGSEAWLYGFSKIPVFTIGEKRHSTDKRCSHNRGNRTASAKQLEFGLFSSPNAQGHAV